VQVGDLISSVGSSEVGCDGNMQMDIKVAALLSEARARGEPFITIRFNSGAKSADFKLKSQLTAAIAQGKLHTLHRKQAMINPPAEGNSAPPLHGAASSFLANGCPVSPLPSPAQRMRRVIAQGMSVEEQREQERQNARAEAAAAAAIPTSDLEAALMQTTIVVQHSDV
jgi:hypothetical protein